MSHGNLKLFGRKFDIKLFLLIKLLPWALSFILPVNQFYPCFSYRTFNYLTVITYALYFIHRKLWFSDRIIYNLVQFNSHDFYQKSFDYCWYQTTVKYEIFIVIDAWVILEAFVIESLVMWRSYIISITKNSKSPGLKNMRHMFYRLEKIYGHFPVLKLHELVVVIMSSKTVHFSKTV